MTAMATSDASIGMTTRCALVTADTETAAPAASNNSLEFDTACAVDYAPRLVIPDNASSLCHGFKIARHVLADMEDQLH